jgi:hypothetical protein
MIKLKNKFVYLYQEKEIVNVPWKKPWYKLKFGHYIYKVNNFGNYCTLMSKDLHPINRIPLPST